MFLDFPLSLISSWMACCGHIMDVTGSRERVWERPLDRGKLGTGHYVILIDWSDCVSCRCAMSDDIYLCF